MSEVFGCDDKDTLVAYLYGDVDLEVRREVDRHLRTCAACMREIDELQTVRQHLQTWRAPEPVLDFEVVPRSSQPIPSAAVLTSARWSRLREMPAWARVAAAALFIGVGLGLANVQIRSTRDGVIVTTGWVQPPTVAAPAASAPAPAATPSGGDDWRAALAALEKNLRSEIAAQPVAATRAAADRTPAANVDTAAVMQRVRHMISESEERQRQEIATKLIQTQRFWDVRRQSDLANVQRTLGTLQNRNFVVQANQQEAINQLKRASFTPPNQ